MIRINLLPHREEARKQRRTNFYAAIGAMAALGVIVGLLVSFVIDGFIEAQEDKNAFLSAEIAKLDKDIAEIKRLRSQIDALLARKKVIESLQGSRAETVHLLNALARQTPEAVYLSHVKQTGREVELTGYAQSNARVSTFMRNLEGSEYLEKPQLKEVKADEVDGRRVSRFVLAITLAQPKAPEDEANDATRKGAQ